MNVLFVNPMTSKYTRSVSTPLGLLSIATFLKSKGHTVKIYDRSVDKTGLETVISTFCPDVAGISLVSYKSIKDALAVAGEFKKNGLPVIFGGPLASELVEMTLDYDCVDVVSIGEGEYTWLELVDFYDGKISGLEEIQGIAFKTRNGRVVRTEPRAFINLGVLPALDWSLINVPEYFQQSYGCKKMLYLYAAKGCPFSCAFCYNKEFHHCSYRKRPLEILLEEIRTLVTDYGMDGVYFADELWCTNRKEMIEICDKLKALNLDFVWGCQTRIGIFDAEDFRYMFNSGCRWIFFGVESGSKTVLEKINKKIDYDKIAATFRACRQADIACVGSFIIGFPDETVDDVKATIKLIKTLDTELINFNFLALVPGSEIYKDLIATGRYKEADNLEDFARKNPLDKLEYNFSKIPDIDMKVIRAFFMWRSFTAKNVPGTESYGFAKKVISDAVNSVNTGDFINFAFSTFNAGMEFLKNAFYAHCFPKIKRKYGLDKFG